MDVKGKKVVVTGVFVGIKRDEAEAGLIAAGATVSGSVSKHTDILFVGSQAGSKLAKAQALGVTVADEAQLRKVLGTKIPKAKLAVRAKEEAERKQLEAQSLAGSGAPPSELKDKCVVVTGTLSVERDEFEALLRRAGARITGSVSKTTDFLVVGPGAGSKLTKARSLGVRTLSEAQARAAIAPSQKSSKASATKKTPSRT